MSSQVDRSECAADRTFRASATACRGLVLVAVVVVVVFGAPSSAGAHGGQGAERPPASNYRTEITSVAPEVDGVSVAVVDAGSRLELRNTSGADVVVLGYDGDPYLRVGPDGVFENAHSSATALNAERFGRTPIPISADSDAAPVWRRVSSDDTVRWHDHRAHWMSETPPAPVLADPERRTMPISEWSVPLLVDGADVTVSGTMGWVQPLSPVWWWLAALAIALLVVLAGRRWRTATPTAGAAVLLVATLINAAGAWAATPGGVVPRLEALVLPVLLWSMLCAGMLLLVRRNRVEGQLMIGAASAGLAWVFGFADLGWLSSAVLPTAVSAPVARTTVAFAVGLGVGLVLHTVLEVGPPLVERARARAAATDLTGTRDGSLASTLGVVRVQRWLLLLPVVVIIAALGLISSSDDTAATIAPTLADEVCSATGGGGATMTDELHVSLHQLVASTAPIDPDLAQRLSDTVDAVGPDGATAAEAAAVRADADAALVANGQDGLDCERS